MEWLDRMNAALAYLEAHLCENIDYALAAREACCSLSHFQRVFAFVADLSPSEYVRCRRMAMAGEELQTSDIRVVDLAQKYGYESPEAFTRAFLAFHGVAPSSARRSGSFRSFPPLVFRIQAQGGGFHMGTKPLVRIEEHSRERVVSFEVNCRGPEEAAWNLLRAWTSRQVSDSPARRYIGCAPKGHHPQGETHQPDEGEGYHEYTAQMFLLADEGQASSFRGAKVRDAPQGLFLVGDVALDEFQSDGSVDIGSSMQKSYGVMAQCLQEFGGYAFDFQGRPYYEEHVFSPGWFAGKGDLVGFKLWLPIRKITSGE